ncbi:DNA mismatch endonuclease Vsr [Rhodobacteraceae bacterium W635]|uniref:very short patch repair endonuclease n=1 Tax=Nioella halotolerans TaxID=2303578 RepID=UPI000E3E4F79|nr:DNA mismatch endonuclease Vsr [Rhodobacteraceae bacterium W635]
MTAHKPATSAGESAVSEQRSRIMRSVAQKDTKPEMALRWALHARGFRYRLHTTKVRGQPDLVLPKYRTVVFVHGCFWHRHPGCRYATNPKMRAEFWEVKFAANVARDSAVRAALLEAGWRVATIWECALRKPEKVAAAADQLSTWLLSETETLELGEREVSSPKGEGEDVSSCS